jgi:hypothetical protein
VSRLTPGRVLAACAVVIAVAMVAVIVRSADDGDQSPAAELADRQCEAVEDFDPAAGNLEEQFAEIEAATERIRQDAAAQGIDYDREVAPLVDERCPADQRPPPGANRGSSADE